MAKVSRSTLKTIVKECLVEIFTEMNNVPPQNPASNSRSQARLSEEARLARHRHNLDQRQIAHDNKVAQTVNQVTSDPLLSRILHDTATSTLVEQLEADHHSPGSIVASDAASMATGRGNPMDMFGDVADNWAALAFAEKKGK